jgi:NAD(P)-dependent dehydrogenase (short-subunit alcohol dehydrogenase family)
MKLRDRYAIITGASEGFGEQIARRFAREGASLLLCARRDELLQHVQARLSEELAPGQRVLVMPVDVTSEKGVKSLVACAVDQFPRLDILVNCAGVAGPRGSSEDVSWEEWKKAIDINLNGTALPSMIAAREMKKNRYGKIINMSGGGATKPLPQLSSYAASKAAVVRLTETMAVELKEYGIDVNAVAPGILHTKLVEDFMEVGEGTLGKAYFDEVARQKIDKAPAFDLATGLCVYLASAESDGITGKLISAPWDPWETLHEHKDELMKTDIYALRRIVPSERGQAWGDRPK